MSDLIYRQKVIDALDHVINNGVKSKYVDEHFITAEAMKEYILAQPSAHPDIIRCNACKHWAQTTGNMLGFGLGDCDYLNAKLVSCNGFCYWAERREDE